MDGSPGVAALLPGVDHSLPAGFTSRPATSGDVDPIMGLMAASAMAAVGVADVTRDEVESDLATPGLDLERDSWLVHDRSGAVAAFGFALDDGSERVFVDVYLHPDHDDVTYREVGGWLMDQGLARLQVRLEGSKRPSVVVGSGCYRSEHRQADLLVGTGMAWDRTFWRMHKDLSAADTDPVELPPAVRIRLVDFARESDRLAAHRISNDAFREHHGFVEVAADDFWKGAERPPLFDPTQWWLAEVDGEPAGLLIADESRTETGVGYVRTLGVLPQFRGRGVAKSLLRTAWAEFAGRDRTATELGVDSENSTGATALYESVGMRPTLVIDFYELTLQV